MERNNPTIYKILKIADPRGNLSVIQHPSTLPFEPARVYWVTDVPSGMNRFGHAYYSSREVIVALSGSIEISTESSDGHMDRFTLSSPDQALYIPPMTWRELSHFATNSVALIVSDTLFDELDYIRDHDYFRSLTTGEAREDYV